VVVVVVVVVRGEVGGSRACSLAGWLWLARGEEAAVQNQETRTEAEPKAEPEAGPSQNQNHRLSEATPEQHHARLGLSKKSCFIYCRRCNVLVMEADTQQPPLCASMSNTTITLTRMHRRLHHRL
jgi:hypothetical protein